MGAQIKLFNKNQLDLSNEQVVVTVSDAIATNDGADTLNYMRNRNNTSGWVTTDSTDASNTTLVFNMIEERAISDILVILHNLKAYTIKYWNGSTYVDFSTPIAETTNTATTNHYEFTQVNTSRIQVVITGTQVVDADKIIRQFIATTKVLTGQLTGWPEIKKPTHSTNKKINKMLSGKVNVVESAGAFTVDLNVKNWNIDADLSIVEEIYLGRRGILVWLCGGNENQFSHKRIGYRLEDIYLMRAVNDYTPEWVSGIYTNGVKINLKMSEAIE